MNFAINHQRLRSIYCVASSVEAAAVVSTQKIRKRREKGMKKMKSKRLKARKFVFNEN